MSARRPAVDYDPGAIEPRWQARWAADGLYAKPTAPARPYYALTMYPYPSGNLHIGHWFAYAPPDAHARFERMRGHDVFFPFGFDAFGLPAENAAIRHSVPPGEWTLANIAKMRAQLQRMGTMIAWEAEVVTCAPEYYRWNQWFFLRFLERDLAYRQKAAVDFCPSCNTTLAREQVVGEARVCERCGTPVEKRELTQWFFRITRYAEELLAGHATLDWPERVKTMQRNWIGRSAGAEIVFRAPGKPDVPVFTTRADTLFGATAVVLAPEHDLVEAFTTPEQATPVAAYREQAARRTEIDRLSAEREKTGVATGGEVRHPFTGAPLPVWVADYVLPTYGTGAVMMVPGHDERDFAFAQSHGLPVVRVIAGPGGTDDLPYMGPGRLVSSGEFDGLETSGKAVPGSDDEPVEGDAKAAIVAALAARGAGKAAVTYRLRDWLVSRQRYWGTPIPVIHCPKCGIVPVPDEDLPVLLPEGVEFRPTGESPLKFALEWRNTTCPGCGGAAERDTDTMDTFVDSSWYQYRYLSPHYTEGPFDAGQMQWLPVPQYTGGIEHATMHLLYTRFWTKAMRDMGLVAFDEPMLALFNQGIVLGADSEKMSKSRGNVEDPDYLVDKYGADAVRAYLMFIGPWNQGGPWDSRGIKGLVRWLSDVWELAQGEASGDGTCDTDLLRAAHQALAAVTADLDRFGFNTAIAQLMTLRNTLRTLKPAASAAAWSEAVRLYLLMAAPLVPHITEELWSRRGAQGSIHLEPWPAADPARLAMDTMEIAVQVRGKVRDRIVLAVDASEEAAVSAALASEAVQRALDGAEPQRVVYVPGRLVNVVV